MGLSYALKGRKLFPTDTHSFLDTVDRCAAQRADEWKDGRSFEITAKNFKLLPAT
jgi:hypothetical protein